jgi:hypothetical protein
MAEDMSPFELVVELGLHCLSIAAVKFMNVPSHATIQDLEATK